MGKVNLDQLCAQFGYQMADAVNNAFSKPTDTENLVTKSLGILQEDGVYAFFLFRASQIKPNDEGKNRSGAARALANQAADFLKHDWLKLVQVSEESCRSAGSGVTASAGWRWRGGAWNRPAIGRRDTRSSRKAKGHGLRSRRARPCSPTRRRAASRRRAPSSPWSGKPPPTAVLAGI